MPLLTLLEKSVDCIFASVPRKMPQLLNTSEICLIAHRGAHNKKQQIVENTETAFNTALALGCWGIELDVHPTADGVLVVNHDPTLNRLWKTKAAIRELSFAKLRQLVPDILSLAEVVERYGKRLHLFIELKAPFNAETTLHKDLQTLIAGVDYHLISLDESVFAAFTIFPSEVLLLVAVHNNIQLFSTLCLQKHYGGVLGHYLLFNDKKLDRLRLANKLVGVGMVDSRFGLYRELNRGLQWIFSNNVASLTHHLQKLDAEVRENEVVL